MFFRRYILPGLIFLSTVIGGGYSTGRELIQFFFPLGPAGGLLGMVVTAIVFSVVLAVSFELSRLTSTWDYRSFIRVLLGRGWPIFEVIYLLNVLVTLAVLGAAAGAVAGESFGWPPILGIVALMAVVGVLVFFGSGAIARALALWALLLYGVYVFIIWGTLSRYGHRIAESFGAAGITTDWLKAGIVYAGYNLSGIPAVLFCLRPLQSRREAISAGLLAGLIAMLPGMLFYTAMMGHYPEIGRQTVPVYYLIGQLHTPWFHVVFEIVFFGVLAKSGIAMLHAVNERVASVYQGRGNGMPRLLRVAIALAALSISALLAAIFGLVTLIAKGYGWLTYAFIAVLIVPVLTVGVWRIWGDAVTRVGKLSDAN